MPRRLHLVPGISPDSALERLSALARDVENIRTGGVPRGPHVFPAGPARDAYVMWVENLERDLLWMTRNPLFTAEIYTERFWRIRELDSGSTRSLPLIESEAAAQAAQLQRLLDDLNERVERARQADGAVAVLDTNVLLHFQRPDSIAWPVEIGSPQVRVLVPLRVVEELDEKKYSDSRKLASRARQILPWLEKTVGPGGEPLPLREGVTIEVPVEGRTRKRTVDADEEILGLCAELAQLGNERVCLVTADTGMRLRAGSQNTPTHCLGAGYARGEGESSVA